MKIVQNGYYLNFFEKKLIINLIVEVGLMTDYYFLI